MATDADVAAASPYGEDPQKAAAAAMAMTSPCPLLPGAKAAAAAMPSVFCFHSICYSVNLGRKKSLIRRCIEPCVGLAAKRKSTQFTSISDDEAKASAPPKIRVILNEISGFARSGEVLAIMGSSGCGKTTLLDVLSHRIASAAASAGPLAGGRTGYIELGDKPTTDDLMRRISAYVMQDDLMYATLTARETLMFSAEMNLPRSFSYKEKQERVERLLELLSLQHAANTLIGNENLRGVSGGERKRVAIGAHIVHDPKILFLDEPTSGLDSSNAYRVVKILKDIALTSESIVIMVIHQPSFRVLEQIDQLLMLSTGNMIFFGPPPHLPAFFDAFGTPVPKFANPTEFALELLEQLKSTSEAALMELVAFAADWHRSRDHMAYAKTGRHAKPALLAAPGGGGDGEETDSGGGSGAGAHGRKGADGKKFCGLAGKLGKKGGKKGEEEEEEEVVESGHKGTHRYANSWFREFYILFVRSGLMIIRNPLLYFLRLMLLTVAGFLLASLFYKPTHDPQGMLERLAYLSFIVAMLFFCSADATPIFIMERNIFIRETSHNTYRASTYVVATMAVYIPLQALMAMTLTLESWWTVGLSGGFPGALFFATICFLCLFTGNAIATFASSFFKNMILAYATVISTMAYFTLVSGFYIHRTSIPKFWIWLHYISPMKYAFEALVQNEFVRDSGPCYLTLNGAFDIEPISTYVNTTRLKPALMSFLPNVVTPGVGPLTSQSCIMTGTFISRKYLDIVELNKYQSMAVLKGDVTEVLIDWIRAARLQLRESFGSDFPVLRLHSDRGGEFSSARLGAFYRAQGICQTFTLPASPQQNGIAERRIGMVMDVAPQPSAPGLLARDLPHRWTGMVGHASAFRVWGSRAFVRDLSAEKLSPRAVPCDVTFDDSVPYYRLFPYRNAPLPPPPLFLAPGPPPVDPLPPQGPAPSGVSQVDAVEPVEVAVDSGAARGAEPVGAGSGGAEPGGAESGGAESGDYAANLVAESVSVCPPSVGGECALSTDVLEDRQEEFLCFSAALPHLVSTLLAPEGDPDAPDIPTPRSYAEAIEGPYSSQWQSAMDAEMASWKSTGTYVDEVPPPGANIVSGMWIFRVKRPPGSPPVFKARYVARGFSQRQGVDYFKTFSPTPKMTTLRGSLHEEIWLRRPPGFTGSFPPSTQWSLRRPVYGLRQAPREWHDTLRTTLAALGFAPSTADPSLFLRTDTSLPLFYILVYVDDLVFATADTAGLAHVKSELQKRHTCTDLGELRSYLGLQITRDRAQRTITLTQSHMVQQVLQRFDFTYSSPQATPLSTRHSLSALPSDESVEPSGPYPELVGCLMYLMTCTRPDLAYPLSMLARYVAPGRHRPEHMAAAKRVLRCLCSTSGLGLVLGGRCLVVLIGHADASWADDQATQRSSQGYTFSLGSGSVSWQSTRSSSVLGSSCEAEIYAGAMAAQELRWLTYLLADLGEPPRSPPNLTKHIALRYFLARELQQRGQPLLAYVASEANTADIFTKALRLLACFA
ncbi:unnamed protein product [Closterium sp. NIES-53]